MRILVDMDGVLADFEQGFFDRWQAMFPHLPAIPTTQRRHPLVQDEYPPDLREQVLSVFRQPGFFRTLPPIPGGREALEAMQAMGVDVWLCTTPLVDYRHCVVEKYAWVEAHLGARWIRRMILTQDKTLVRANLLIDDRPNINGAATPTWEHVIFDQPYNRHLRDKRRITWQTWRDVLFPEAE